MYYEKIHLLCVCCVLRYNNYSFMEVVIELLETGNNSSIIVLSTNTMYGSVVGDKIFTFNIMCVHQ